MSVLAYMVVSDFTVFAIPWQVTLAAVLVFYVLLAITIFGIVKILNAKQAQRPTPRGNR